MPQAASSSRRSTVVSAHADVDLLIHRAERRYETRAKLPRMTSVLCAHIGEAVECEGDEYAVLDAVRAAVAPPEPEGK